MVERSETRPVPERHGRSWAERLILTGILAGVVFSVAWCGIIAATAWELIAALTS